jgi:hypothetical protein
MLGAANWVHERNMARGARSQERCRRRFNIVLTDRLDQRGLGNCATPNNAFSRITNEVVRMAHGAAASKTIFVGVGPHYKSRSARSDLDRLARLGGMAVDPFSGVFDGRNGAALYARTPEALDTALDRAFGSTLEGEYQGGRAEVATLWTVKSEVGRVRDNALLVPLTELPGNRGHLRAYRLFHERTAYAGDWSFRGEPTLRWDAGDLLSIRSSFPDGRGGAQITRPRRMFTAVDRVRPRVEPVNWPAGALRRAELTWPIQGNERLEWYRNFDLKCRGAAPADAPCKNVQDLNKNSFLNEDFDRRIALSRMIMKLRGAAIDPDASGAHIGDEQVSEARGFFDRDHQWKLGALVHSSPVTGQPGRNQFLAESDVSYLAYADAVKEAPPMAFVGAGYMIHSFFPNASSRDGYRFNRQDHAAGEEAWAYLPRNLHHRLRGFFSDDFSQMRSRDPALMDARCRLTEAKLDLDQAADRGGWSMVLVCPMGKGGRALVALDVTDPDGPLPIWEFSHAEMGETWSIPALGRVATGETEDAHVVIAASGVDNVVGAPNPGQDRWRNDVPAVFVIDLATGRVLKKWRKPRLTGQAVFADVSAIDHSGDGLIDLAYIGTSGGVLLTLDMHRRGARSGPRHWALLQRDGSYSGGLPITGGPVIDMAKTGAETFDVLITGRDVSEVASVEGKGSLLVVSEREPERPGASRLRRGCNLLRARGGSLARNERPVGRPVISDRVAFFTTVQDGDTCNGATHRLRCVNLDTCASTCSVTICDPGSGEVCGLEPAPPTYLADGRIYAYSSRDRTLKAIARVTPEGVEEAIAGAFRDREGVDSLQANQSAPRNLVLNWREVY